MDEQKRQERAAGLLSLGHFSIDNYSNYITPLLPFIAAKMNITISIISLIISFSHLGASIFQPVFGHIADHFKKRFFVFWGMVLAAVFMPLAAMTNNVWLLGLFILIGSIGIGFYHPQASGLVNKFGINKISKNMGIFLASGTIGYACGPVFSSFIVKYFGYDNSFVGIIPGVIVAFLIYFLLPKIPQNFVEAKKEETNLSLVIKEVLKNKILMILIWVAIVKSLVAMTFTFFIPFVLKDYNYSVVSIGILISTFSLLGGLGSFIGGKIVPRTGAKLCYYISVLPILPMSLGFLFFLDKSVIWFSILFALSGFFTFFSASVNMVMAQNLMPEHKGFISGIIGGFCWGVIGIMLTPIGFLAEKTGIIPILVAISFIAFASSILVKYLPEDQAL